MSDTTADDDPIPFRRWAGAAAEGGVFEQECEYLGVGVDASGAHEDLAAICLSGGGIRSAAFAMGVISGLAREGVLDKFHYLSTVSGGGYTGAWLSAWIRRHKYRLSGVLHDLTRASKTTRVNVEGEDEPDPTYGTRGAASVFVAGRHEPEPVRWVRAYCSYLSPRLGPLSLDTWTLVGTYIRNLVINWAVILTLFAALLVLPYVAYGFTSIAWACAVAPAPVSVTWCTPCGSADWLYGASLFLTTLALGYFHWQRPTALGKRRRQNIRPRRARLGVPRVFGRGRIMLWVLCVGPLLLAMTLLNPWLLARVEHGHPLAAMMAFGALANLFGWLGATLVELPRAAAFNLLPQRRKRPWRTIVRVVRLTYIGGRRWRAQTRRIKTTAKDRLKRVLYWVGYCAAIVAAGALGGWVAVVTARWVRELPGLELQPPPLPDLAWPLVVGPWLLVLVWFSASTLFIGLVSSPALSDNQDREFWARSGSDVIRWGGALFGWSLISLQAPNGWRSLLVHASGIVGSLGSVTGVLTVLGALFGAMSPLTNAFQDRDRSVGPLARLVDGGVRVLAPLSLVLLFSLGAMGIGNLAGEGLKLVQAHSSALRSDGACGIGCDVMVSSILLAALLAFIVLLLSWAIELQEFSLHALYRERLARTFLGASHGARNSSMSDDIDRRLPERIPNAYTSFDSQDDLPMAALYNPRAVSSDDAPAAPDVPEPSRPFSGRLLPVFNITLNATRFTQANLELQHRKALPFTVTPLHAGCADGGLGYRSIWRAPTPYGGGRRGIKLATAMTLSGAAASPNMGYHSSPAVTLLLTLFNLRLGRWLGNPGSPGKSTYGHASPGLDLEPLLKEAFSQVDAEQEWVYLSDGGHFDNLGLYEMVRRRCKTIVVADASADPQYAYNDLARTLQAIRTDFGIRIEVIGSAGCTAEPRDGAGAGVAEAAGRIVRLMHRGAPTAAKDPWIGAPMRLIVARICYDGAAAPGSERSSTDVRPSEGRLIYLKPIVCPDDPVELVNRKLRSKAFPHDSTLHQLFDERTFESYRLLGQHTVTWLYDGQAAPGRAGPDRTGAATTTVRQPDGRDLEVADMPLSSLVDAAMQWCSDATAGTPAKRTGTRKPRPKPAAPA